MLLLEGEAEAAFLLDHQLVDLTAGLSFAAQRVAEVFGAVHPVANEHLAEVLQEVAEEHVAEALLAAHAGQHLRLGLAGLELFPEQAVRSRPFPLVALGFKSVAQLEHSKLASQFVAERLGLEHAVVVFGSELQLVPLHVLVAGSQGQARVPR